MFTLKSRRNLIKGQNVPKHDQKVQRENKIEKQTPVHSEIMKEPDQGPKCTQVVFILNLGGGGRLKGDSKMLFFTRL